jgi:hypothetical protein
MKTTNKNSIRTDSLQANILKLGPPTHEAGELTTQPQYLVLKVSVNGAVINHVSFNNVVSKIDLQQWDTKQMKTTGCYWW